MTPRQITLARHALGLPNLNNVARRNSFVVDPGGRAFADWQAMVEAGLAGRRGPLTRWRGQFVFYLKPAAIAAALTAYETAGERLRAAGEGGRG